MSDFTISTLISLPGAEFIRALYRVLLGREVDDDGFEHYKKRLLGGIDRASIIADLAASTEGRAFAAKLPGLAKLQKRERWVRMPVLGGLVWRYHHGCSRGVSRRFNSIQERSQFSEARHVHVKDPLSVVVESKVEGKEFQYLCRMILAMASRQLAEREKQAGFTSHDSPLQRFHEMMRSLEQDDAGNLHDIEAPELMPPGHLDRLPPHSAAIMLMLG